VKKYVNAGAKQRATCTTQMNLRSSRSHRYNVFVKTDKMFSIVTLKVVAKPKNESQDALNFKLRTTKARLHLVDLAGSECVSQSGVTGSNLRESSYVNRSLGK